VSFNRSEEEKGDGFFTNLASAVGVVVWLQQKGQVGGATRGLSDVGRVDGPQTDASGVVLSRAPSRSIVSNAF